jgi:hypothetical protein
MRWQKHIPMNMALRLPAGSINGGGPKREAVMVEMRQAI